MHIPPKMHIWGPNYNFPSPDHSTHRTEQGRCHGGYRVSLLCLANRDWAIGSVPSYDMVWSPLWLIGLRSLNSDGSGTGAGPTRAATPNRPKRVEHPCPPVRAGSCAFGEGLLSLRRVEALHGLLQERVPKGRLYSLLQGLSEGARRP